MKVSIFRKELSSYSINMLRLSSIILTSSSYLELVICRGVESNMKTYLKMNVVI